MPQKPVKVKAQGKDTDRDLDTEKHHRRKTSRTHSKTATSSDGGATRLPGSSGARRKKEAGPELKTSRASNMDESPSVSRTSLPYPTFSKAHSKERVNGDIDLDVFSPNPAELAPDDARKRRPRAVRTREVRREGRTTTAAGPPTPPLTSTSLNQGREEDAKGEAESSADSEQGPDKRRPGRGASVTSKATVADASQPGKKPDRPQSRSHRDPDAANPTRKSTPPRTESTASVTKVGQAAKSADGDKAPFAGRPPEVESVQDSDDTSATEVLLTAERIPAPLPVRPTWSSSLPQAGHQLKEPSGIPRPDHASFGSLGPRATLATSPAPQLSPQPPPPPPPPVAPAHIPRVDYLLHNGGLSYNVPRTLSAAFPEALPEDPFYPAPDSGALPPRSASPSGVEKLFAPFHDLLSQYETVLSRSGSIAVATGYRSVARRLLDRLEAVFARDISSEYCGCFLCQDRFPYEQSEQGIGWGDVLEWVSGRKAVPPWPLFDFGKLGEAGYQTDNKMATSSRRNTSMLKTETSRNAPLDADVPDEFRDHYRKQTKKTRDAVDKWLAVQPTDPSPPPREIDDETLGFAILTHLRPDERDPFKALMEHSHHNPVTPNEPESLAAARSELLSRAGSALQRLYRLASPPRDPECAAFLVRYRHLHRVLATLAAVNDSEWDVLTSGRFDGFLWSGADDTHPVTGASPNPSRNATPWNVAAGPGPSQPAVSFSRLERSRTNTPIKILGAVAGASVSRDGTPASATAASPIPPPPPVSIDEETEIAVLAEVEREIYLGMEVLEDAFEALHLKAENVRQALRERGAGLSMAGHSRRLAAAAPYSRGAGGGGGGDGGGMPTSASPTDGAGSDFGRGTPYSAGGGGGGDGGWDSMAANVGAGHGGAGSREADALSDVWPDDSASNISSNRVRRPKRRNQRRTPAPVDEGVEED